MRTLLIAVFLLTAAQCDAGSYADLIKVAALKTHPNPAPAPAPSGQCDNCGGTGKLGDGTVSVTCPVCDGTGKAKQVPPAPVTRAIQSHAPVKPTRQTAPAGGFYPTDSSHWTFPGSGRGALISHLLSDSKHRGQFTRSYLESLSYQQLATLHDHDHEGRVQRQYVNGSQPANRGGRWVTQRICQNGRCRTVRVWHPY